MSFRSDLAFPELSVRPYDLATAGSTRARVAEARRAMPSIVPAALQAWLVASTALHVGIVMPDAIFVRLVRDVSRSEEKIVPSSGSYVSAPSLVQVVLAVSWHSSGAAAAPAAVCQCLWRVSMSWMNRSSLP